MTEQQQKQSIKSKLVIGLIKLLASLPLAVSCALLRPFVWLQQIVPNRSKDVIDLNLAYCGFSKDLPIARKIRNACMRYSANLIAETSYIWLHDYQDNRKLLHKIHGEEAFKEALNKPNGTLIISPHLGNWELGYSYISNNYQSAGLYKPPQIKELEPIMLAGRGGEVLRTSAMEVRKMLKLLKQGGSLFLLPDQTPPEGSGVFAPFFDQPAYTMTLLHGLAKKTGADIWMGVCVKVNGKYELSLYPLDLDAGMDADAFNIDLNRMVEEVISLTPEQYQWSYKRFKRTPDGSTSIYDRNGE